MEEQYDDANAELLTLKQTNGEYKKTLASKVKEIMSLQLENENGKKIW